VGYKNWLRITFAIDPSSLEDGLDRLKSFCLRHSKPAKWYDKLIGSLQHKRKKLLWTSSDLWYGTIFTRRWYLWCARSLVSIGLGFYQVIIERRCNMSSPSVAVGVTQILRIWSVQRINKGLYENCHLIIAFIWLFLIHVTWISVSTVWIVGRYQFLCVSSWKSVSSSKLCF